MAVHYDVLLQMLEKFGDEPKFRLSKLTPRVCAADPQFAIQSEGYEIGTAAAVADFPLR